ncbi:hypothetical protein ACHHYP_13422 [Achlya hypogyna]|uniref:Cytosolic endo-beta-N-acetylglucosaminidase TIM barrel domain-containing protein n=1 Tax=Achlya hypogyna TaxID=1202772 RepID=A0A1V9YFC3_ACHHY|nr:hypothetical protein ACHHYP_13422 [Achlya hypogyna]
MDDAYPTLVLDPAWLVAIAVAFIVGAVSIAWYGAQQQPEPPKETPVPPPTKFETFVFTQVAAAPLVLFTSRTEAPILALLQRAHANFLHIDLERIAGRAGIEAVLRACDDADGPEFLFFNGEFIGSTEHLLELHRSGALAEQLHAPLPPFSNDSLACPALSLSTVTSESTIAAKTQLTIEEVSHNPLDVAQLPANVVPLAERPRAQNDETRSQLLVHLASTVMDYPWDVMDYLALDPTDSSALVTLPEPGWVDAAHRNGVYVLATLSWSDAADDCWQHPGDLETLATNLLAAALRCGIDGWIVTGMAVSSSASTHLLPALHHETSRVLWTCVEATTDAPATVDGLLWRHDWTHKDVLALKKAHPALTLFFHLPVHSDLQARSLRFAGVAVSIDAPASQEPFWPTTWRSLGPVIARSNSVATSFDSGYGELVAVHGDFVVTGGPWRDPGHMELQPKSIATKMKGPLTASISRQVAYLGGSSLLVEGSVAPKNNAMLDVLATDVIFAPRKVLCVEYSFLNWTPNVAVNVVLWLAGRREHLMLRGPPLGPPSPKRLLSPLVGRSALGAVYGASSETLHATSGWVTRRYHLGGQLWEGKTIVAIGVAAINLRESVQVVSAHLGHVVVGEHPLEAPLPPSVYTDVHWEGATLRWTMPAAVAATCVYRADGACVAYTRQPAWLAAGAAPGEYLLRPLGWSGAFLAADRDCPRVLVTA